ncbi:hypothetical protein CLV69_103307 [Amycolatopsis arida]|nr:hypothetical protein CLV69_103307 [Amycolatopsis arida]
MVLLRPPRRRGVLAGPAAAVRGVGSRAGQAPAGAEVQGSSPDSRVRLVPEGCTSATRAEARPWDKGRHPFPLPTRSEAAVRSAVPCQGTLSRLDTVPTTVNTIRFRGGDHTPRRHDNPGTGCTRSGYARRTLPAQHTTLCTRRLFPSPERDPRISRAPSQPPGRRYAGAAADPRGGRGAPRPVLKARGVRRADERTARSELPHPGHRRSASVGGSPGEGAGARCSAWISMSRRAR